MLAILNFLNAHNLPIFQQILMILVSKFKVHRALSDKIYLSLGLLSPLIICKRCTSIVSNFNMVAIQKQQIKLNLPDLCKQFGPKPGLTEYRLDLDLNPLVTPYQYKI